MCCVTCCFRVFAVFIHNSVRINIVKMNSVEHDENFHSMDQEVSEMEKEFGPIYIPELNYQDPLATPLEK